MQRQRIGKRHWKTRDDPPVQSICINAARKVVSGSVGSENRPWPTCLAMTAPVLVLLSSHSYTQWGQLGEILGGVKVPRRAAKRGFRFCPRLGKLCRNTGNMFNQISEGSRPAVFNILLQQPDSAVKNAARFGSIAYEMASLKEQREKIAARLRKDQTVQLHVHTMEEALDGMSHRMQQWDEEMIRQLVHTVKVISADHIKVYLYDGTEIDQKVSP